MELTVRIRERILVKGVEKGGNREAIRSSCTRHHVALGIFIVFDIICNKIVRVYLYLFSFNMLCIYVFIDRLTCCCFGFEAPK